VFVFFFF